MPLLTVFWSSLLTLLTNIFFEILKPLLKKMGGVFRPTSDKLAIVKTPSEEDIERYGQPTREPRTSRRR